MIPIDEVAARVIAASTYHPNWVAQHLPIFGDDLARALGSDQYARIVTQLQADSRPATLNDATGNAYLLLYGREAGDIRKRLTPVQQERYIDMLARVMLHDVRTSDPFTPEGIKVLRTQLGDSQEEFAARGGWSLSTVASWESGRRNPGEEARARLAALRDEA